MPDAEHLAVTQAEGMHTTPKARPSIQIKRLEMPTPIPAALHSRTPPIRYARGDGIGPLVFIHLAHREWTNGTHRMPRIKS